jgi:hypothetical protein
MGQDPSEARKRAYHKPKLKLYGDIRELTETKGLNGKQDGGIGKFASLKTG